MDYLPNFYSGRTILGHFVCFLCVYERGIPEKLTLNYPTKSPYPNLLRIALVMISSLMARGLDCPEPLAL